MQFYSIIDFLSFLFPSGLNYSTSKTATTSSEASPASSSAVDVTAAVVTSETKDCCTPKEAQTDLLNFLNQSDIQKRRTTADIPFFTAGSYLSVTRADPASPSGISKFVGICIAKRNKGLGSTFILRNVINGIGVEMMFELFSPALKEIKVLKLERRRRAKLYYLRDKPLKYSTVNEKMQHVDTKGKILRYRRRGAPA